MEKLYFEIEFADNGVIIRDTDAKTVCVYQEQKSDKGDAKRYTDRALYDGIFCFIRDVLINGTDKVQPKEKYKLRIEIR